MLHCAHQGMIDALFEAQPGDPHAPAPVAPKAMLPPLACPRGPRGRGLRVHRKHGRQRVPLVHFRRRVGKAVLARASNSPPSMRGACCLVGRIIGPSLLRPLQRDKGQPPPTWALLANLPPLARAAAPPAWPTPKKDVRSRTHHDLFCPKPAQSDVGLAGPEL